MPSLKELSNSNAERCVLHAGVMRNGGSSLWNGSFRTVVLCATSLSAHGCCAERRFRIAETVRSALGHYAERRLRIAERCVPHAGTVRSTVPRTGAARNDGSALRSGSLVPRRCFVGPLALRFDGPLALRLVGPHALRFVGPLALRFVGPLALRFVGLLESRCVGFLALRFAAPMALRFAGPLASRFVGPLALRFVAPPQGPEVRPG